VAGPGQVALDQRGNVTVIFDDENRAHVLAL
jgi:hypothetical protein